MPAATASASGPFKMLTVVGARPQFVKAATVSRAVAGRDDLREVLVHTGQHFDANMSDVFFRELAIPEPDYRLDIHGGGHGQMTGRMMIELEAILEREKPDLVLVYGDTNSTLAGALCAAKLNMPIAHVEAGVRSYDRSMPEEVNRVLTDALAALRLVPVRSAVENLAKEGVREGVIHVGDVNYDATLMLTEAARRTSTIVGELGLQPGAFDLATVHRAAVVDDPEALAEVFAYLRDEARARVVVLPIHPRTRAALQRSATSTEGLRLVDPVGPLDMHALLEGCVMVFTDSGGLQKEAFFHGKPCVTLRDVTEWTETVENGWNRLWKGPDFAPRKPIDDYGDGHTAERVVAAVVEYLGARPGRS